MINNGSIVANALHCFAIANFKMLSQMLNEAKFAHCTDFGTVGIIEHSAKIQNIESFKCYKAIHTFFTSVKNFIASHPPSLPTPLPFTPPKGVRKSRNNQQLIQTIPICN